jgi:hypothetical protein
MIDQNQILWDEKNLTELQNSCKNKNEQETSDITKDIKTSSTQNDWRNITDPKLRKKMKDKEWYILNKERIKALNKIWREKNKDKIKNDQIAYRQANKEKIRFKRKLFYEKNKDRLAEKSKNYRKINRDKVNLYTNNLRRSNVQFRLAHNLRARLRDSLKNNYKSGSAVKNLGCSLEELKTHLESKFQPGMNWDNWSSNGWHIDHIKPLSSFDLSNKDELLKACHYTNLQPLWAKDNLIKGDKITF